MKISGSHCNDNNTNRKDDVSWYYYMNFYAIYEVLLQGTCVVIATYQLYLSFWINKAKISGAKRWTVVTQILCIVIVAGLSK